MQLSCRAVLSLLLLTVVGSYGYVSASLAAEDCWHSLWADPIPKVLQDLVQPTELNKSSNAQPYDINAPGKVEDTEFPEDYFLEQDLHPGKKLNLQFSVLPFSEPFLSAAWARGVNLDIKSLRTKRFTIKEICDAPPAVGEHKMCATSLESLVNYAISRLGKEIQPLSSSFVPHQKQYKILKGVENVEDNGMMCHRLNFRKVVFSCHQVNATYTYKVPLEAIDGTKTIALATCHHDTRGMDADLLYEKAKVLPGTVPVCHFIGFKDVVWVPTNN